MSEPQRLSEAWAFAEVTTAVLQMRGPRSVATPVPWHTCLNVSMHADGFLCGGKKNTFQLTMDKAFPVAENGLRQQLKYLFILLLPT